MGWRAQDARERDEAEERRAWFRSLPLRHRVLIRVEQVAILVLFAIVLMLFAVALTRAT